MPRRPTRESSWQGAAGWDPGPSRASQAPCGLPGRGARSLDTAAAADSLRTLLDRDVPERLRSAESYLYFASATDDRRWPDALSDAATLPGRPWSGRRSSVPTDSLCLSFYAGSLSSYLPWKGVGQSLGRTLLLPGLGPAENPSRLGAGVGYSAFDGCTGGARWQTSEECGAPTRLQWWLHRAS